MDLSVIIINWNSKEYLDSCLQDIHSFFGIIDFEIIVIDNASFDGSKEMIEKKYPSVKFFQSAENLGFGKANNLGAKMSNKKVLLFLNPDTGSPGDAIAGLFKLVSEQKEIGLAGCILLNSDGTIQDSSVLPYPTILNQIFDSRILRKVFPRFSWWKNHILFDEGKSTHEVEALSGAFIMVRKEVFEKVGGFDPRYFMYAEDLDISMKIRKAGYKIVLDKSFRVFHHGGGSSAKNPGSQFSNVMMRKSNYQFLKIHNGKASAFGYRISMAITAILRLVILFLMLPFQLLVKGKSAVTSIKKWSSILKWSVAGGN